MVQRKLLVKQIKKEAKAKGAEFYHRRQGGNHEIYYLNNRMIPIPRHKEIAKHQAETIMKEVAIALERKDKQ
ncbi:type II toxin-antitoxin system HicA family toxin [Bifidobacterium sp. ESL0769]|uniref:type II toxin-antitoxin system HicA family toxin n=1 Tax=Bifidobacterium sp. ESL0769 TaxID=2983229 RepID=UPI0023F879AF|nr:type II toxin-antitoxin system HicA family toxin [Bifidobacterium sp. ESL0769]WEV67056.1 type II toxin-antitoxin system HicA family toxin [Bifidobacterium sp. ESL0769]